MVMLAPPVSATNESDTSHPGSAADRQPGEINTAVGQSDDALQRETGLSVEQVTDGLGQGLAALNMLKASLQTSYGTVTPSQNPSDCLVDLARLIPQLLISGTTTSSAANTSALTGVLTRPVEDLGALLKAILAPDPAALNTADFGSMISSTVTQIVKGMGDPFSTILSGQTQALTSSVDAAVSALVFDANTGKNGLVLDYADKVRSTIQAFFGSNTDHKLAGAFIYAFHEGIPAIETELALLKQMRKASIRLREFSASLPTGIDFQLPNFAVVERLCHAELELGVVSQKLRDHSVFDRSSFATAESEVCKAADVIFDGKIDQELLLRHGQNFLGLSGYKDLTTIKLLPDVRFKFQQRLLNTLAQQYEYASPPVSTLFSNLSSAVATLRSLADLHLGDVVAVIVDILKRQISAVRQDLQTQGAGFEQTTPKTLAPSAANTASSLSQGVARLDANLATNPKGSTDPRELNERAQLREARAGLSPRADITAYLESQMAAYVVLTALCQLMRRLPVVFNGVDAALQVESRVMKAVLAVAASFDPTTCGNPDTGQRVSLAVKEYLRQAQLRLTFEVTSNAPLQRALTDMIAAIRAREAFLRCFRSRMTGGLSAVYAAFTAIAAANQAYESYKALVKTYGDLLATTAKAADLKALLGGPVDPAKAILKVLQCLVLSCDSPVVNQTVKRVTDAVQREYDKRQQEAFDSAALDSAAQAGVHAKDNARLQALQRLISTLAGLSSLNLELCKIPAASAPTALTAPTGGDTRAGTNAAMMASTQAALAANTTKPRTPSAFAE